MAWFGGSGPIALERVIGLVGSGRGVPWWWRSGSLRDGTTRRDGVDRLAATLIFAGWDRTSAMRRKVPLTKFAMARPWHRALGDRSCSGGVPARRGHFTSSADLEPANQSKGQAVISAHRNPASSRAMAAATMLLVCLRAARVRNRPDRRCWAAHARATTQGAGLVGGGRSRRRRWGGAGRTRPTRPAGRAGG